MRKVNPYLPGRKVLPQEGGCWYCHTDGGEMCFSAEFDTYLHMPCLLGAWRADPLDPEARIMVRELCPGMLVATPAPPTGG